MPGIVTKNFRVKNALSYKQMVEENNIYFFFGKPLSWDDDAVPDIPVDSTKQERDAWQEMLAMKKVSADNVSLAVRRVDWATGTVYDFYDDQEPFLYHKNYYVKNAQQQIFVCLHNATTVIGGEYGGVASTEEPWYDPAIPGTTIFETADGYVWKYIQTISTDAALKFLTPNWMPIEPIGGEYTGLNNAFTGIYHVNIEGFGSGYDATPGVTIDGDGDGATAVAVMDNGVIIEINITDPGSGYSWATVTVDAPSSGTTATARACCMPRLGLRNAPIYDLDAFYTITQAAIEYDESGMVPVENDYRRFGLIENPIEYDGITAATDAVYNMLYKIEVTSTDLFLQDEELTIGAETGILIAYDTTDPLHKYMTIMDYTGNSIANGATITSGAKSATVVSTIAAPGIERYSGRMMYIEQSTPTTRRSDQSEIFLLISEF